jgi:NADH dehydrogenase [ubiquinone] 1 alpha subcomplex assembly factor 7
MAVRTADTGRVVFDDYCSTAATGVSFKDDIIADIKANGPMPLSEYMRRCNEHYYSTRIPFGKEGDFITAPDISQMFGELIGLWCADLWQRAGSPSPFRLVELGPGRGTLMQDALRATKNIPGFHDALTVHFVEISPVLREEQKKRVPDAVWHNDRTELFPCVLPGYDFCDPFSARRARTLRDENTSREPIIIIANEFFDALPIDQLVKCGEVLNRVYVHLDAAGHLKKDIFNDESTSAMMLADFTLAREFSAESIDIVKSIATSLIRNGGAFLCMDYGYVESEAATETFQAMRDQTYVDPFDLPGEADLTAHVDFCRLREEMGLTDINAQLCYAGPTTQGQFLRKLGLDARAAALARANPERADEFLAQAARLADADQMGTLFKVMAITSKNWPTPAGFDA